MQKYLEYKQELERIQNISIGEKFVITFCGVFSAGKSSLLNCLLNCEEYKLPTGLFPVTKVVTRLRYGKELSFYYEDNGIKKRITKENFEKMVTGEKKTPNNTEEIIVEMPSVILKMGIEILDTPGFNDEMGGRLEEISRNAVLNGDLIVFCTNAVQLGVLFEKDYLKEIQSSHGNFIMIVNRMDNLNTVEDIKSIKAKAEYLMRDKGGNLINNIFGTNIFYTVADGPLKSLAGFDSHLAFLLENKDVTDRLKKEVCINKKRYYYDLMIQKLSMDIWEEREKLEALAKQDRKKRREIKQQQIVENSKNQTKKEVQINRYIVKLNSHLDKVYKYVNQLEQEGRCNKFSVDTKNFLVMQMSYLVSDIRVDFGYDYHARGLINYFNRRVDNFTIPKPIAKSVKKRGFLQRLGETVKTAIDYGILNIGDGCDLVYENYAAPAIRTIESELKPQLQNIIEQIISWKYEIKSEESIQTGYEEEINYIEYDLKKLAEIEDAMRKFYYLQFGLNLKGIIKN